MCEVEVGLFETESIFNFDIVCALPFKKVAYKVMVVMLDILAKKMNLRTCMVVIRFNRNQWLGDTFETNDFTGFLQNHKLALIRLGVVTEALIFVAKIKFWNKHVIQHFFFFQKYTPPPPPPQ